MFFNVYADWVHGDDDDREMAKIETSLMQIIPGLPPKKKPEASS